MLCPLNTHAPEDAATECSACPPELPFAEVGAATCSMAPEHCVEITVAACAGTDNEEVVNGVYTKFEGDCRETGGRTAYYDAEEKMYLYARASETTTFETC
jgi:hypothetical protein